ncbi:response regulator [Aneurinibacillus terranovensis]|uniref:response regulator n=1 Tax=Aneurinibacillus terranovensis TaxID=278991 RepID=UPI00040D47A4|nr:response regulator transcription factor [Aneurinibacillus terranovensis]
MKIKLLLIDDHNIVRSGLSSFLNSQPDLIVVGEASEGTEGLQKIYVVEPDIVICDLSMPKGMDGFTTLQEIHRSHPDLPVLVLTMYEDEIYLKEAIRIGANGLVLKQTDPNQLLEAIHALFQGKKYYDAFFPEETVTRCIKEIQLETRPVTLTVREEEILRLTARGYTNREISDRLVISVKTVENHKSSIMKKLALTSRAELVQYAINHGLMQVSPPS